MSESKFLIVSEHSKEPNTEVLRWPDSWLEGGQNSKGPTQDIESASEPVNRTYESVLQRVKQLFKRQSS